MVLHRGLSEVAGIASAASVWAYCWIYLIFIVLSVAGFIASRACCLTHLLFPFSSVNPVISWELLPPSWHTGVHGIAAACRQPRSAAWTHRAAFGHSSDPAPRARPTWAGAAGTEHAEPQQALIPLRYVYRIPRWLSMADSSAVFLLAPCSMLMREK